MKAPIVKVTWDDAEDLGGQTWIEAEDVAAFAVHSCQVVSVGYIVARTKKHLTLASDWIEENRQFGRVTKIPTAMVVSIKKFK